MRIVIIGLCAAAFAATPALARDANPIGGVGVSVETSPGGIRVQFNNAADARAACVAERGTFSNTAGRLRCANPGPQFARRGRGICIGRGGGSFLPNRGTPTAPPSCIDSAPTNAGSSR